MDRSELTQINLLPMVRQDLKKTPNKQKTLKLCLTFLQTLMNKMHSFAVAAAAA